MGLGTLGNSNVVDITKTHAVTIGAASARTSAGMLADTVVVEVWSTVDCWVARGDSTIEAAATAGLINIPIPASTLVTLVVKSGQYIAGIATVAGTLYVWEHPYSA